MSVLKGDQLTGYGVAMQGNSERAGKASLQDSGCGCERITTEVQGFTVYLNPYLVLSILLRENG